MTHACTLEHFQRDVKNHQMTIEREDGVFRSVFFGRPGTGDCHFRIITYPGGLLITGDCGTYSFERLTDMFEFFRDVTHPLAINPSYWGEKLTSIDKNGGFTEFSGEVLASGLKDTFEYWAEYADPDTAAMLKERLQSEQWFNDSENVDDAFDSLLYALDELGISDGFGLFDLGYTDFTEYTFRFIWCLRAIAFAVRSYDLGGTPAQRHPPHYADILAGRV